MKVMICGHEALTAGRFERILQELGHTAIQYDATMSVAQAVQEQRPQLVIISSTLCRSKERWDLINQNNIYAPAVIAVGEPSECSVAMFKMDVSDFLVAPVSKEELIESLAKVTRINSAQAWVLADKNADQHARQYLAARTHRGVELVSLSDVYYFVADQKYVKVRYKGGVVLIDETLKELEEEFAQQMFRIHRNALINPNYLSLLESVESGQYQVRFRGIEETLYVSRRHLPALREKIHSI